MNELEKQRADVKVPAKGINAMLSFIFGSGKRLALVPNEDKAYYSVKVRDKDVAPEDLSLGELNALAIAYFFTAVASDVTKRPA